MLRFRYRQAHNRADDGVFVKLGRITIAAFGRRCAEAVRRWKRSA